MLTLKYAVSFILFLSLSLAQCPLSFTLPNILKDLVTLTYFSGQQQSSTYPYFPSMFSSSPTLAYSISEIDISSPSPFINFYLEIDNSSFMMFNFYFNALNQNWTHVTVNFWINSRNDLITHIDTLKNIAPGQTVTQNISLAQYPSAAITTNAKHVVFIVGLYASLLGTNLTLSVTPTAITPASASFSVTNGLNSFLTNITVSSVIFDPSNSQFIAYGGTISYSSFYSQTLNLYNSFLPIYYYLLGLNAISASSFNSQTLGYLLDLTNNTVLSLSTPKLGITYDSIAFSYLTIGAAPVSVCASCNNTFIYDSCIPTCPSNTYPHYYSSGGKACLQCSSLLGLQLNDLATACACLPNYQLLTQYQCVPISSVPTKCSGQNVIQNGTACICAPGTYNLSGLCQSCPSSTTFNGSACVSACTGLNQVANPAGLCVCADGYYNISNFCIQCPADTVYLNGVCSPTSCQTNFVLSNGKCVCDQYSIKVGIGCQRCSSGTFPNSLSTACLPCLPNCLNCTNASSCLLCTQNYLFDFLSLSCIPSSNSNVTLRPGFPLFTPTAIVTDFLISSNATLALKNSQQLANMINIKYPNNEAAPYRTLYTQNANNLNQIRLVFDYRCLLPLNSLIVSFNFTEPAIQLFYTLPVTYNNANALLTTTIPD